MLRAILTLTFAGAGGLAWAQPLEGRVEQHSFIGPLTARPVNYSIYLPPDYDSRAGRYPVVYQLHGLGGEHNGSQTQSVPVSFEQGYAGGLIGRVIVVFPDAYTDSFWADSIDGAKPAETNVIDELIPHIDATYRTRAERSGRLVQGFSMGGFGAAKFAAKFPDNFAACVTYDAAFVTWQGMQLFFPTIASGIFGNDADYFAQYSPWTFWELNQDYLRDQMPIRMVVAALPSSNQNFRNFLLSLSITPQYVQTTCGHVLSCILDAEGQASIDYVAPHLAPQLPGDLDGNGAVDIADLATLLADFGCTTNCPTDLDGDRNTALSDLVILLANFGVS
jgi:endo-1,4-beta-xylanase